MTLDVHVDGPRECPAAGQELEAGVLDDRLHRAGVVDVAAERFAAQAAVAKSGPASCQFSPASGPDPGR